MHEPEVVTRTKELLLTLQTTPCVYIERDQAHLVTLGNLEFTGWGFSATAVVRPAPGLPSAAVSWSFSSAWSQLTRTELLLRSPVVGWSLLVSRPHIDKLLDLVANLPTGKSYLDDYESRPAPQGSRFASLRTPGETAAAVQAFLASLYGM